MVDINRLQDVDEEYQTLAERLAGALRNRILLGELEPGQNIPERETSAELNASRTPLREALRILANEGLVEIRPARSPVVANPSAEELGQLFSVMRVLEALAGELTCFSATDADLDGLAAIHDKLSQIDPTMDPLRFFNTDMAYHTQIVALSRNAPLVKTHRDYNARLWRARFLTSRVYRDRERILHEHGEILAGLRARDTRWTSAVMDAHLRTANGKIVEIYAQTGGKISFQ